MTKVKCPNCQYANPPGQENCVRCRTPLPKVSIKSGSDSESEAAASGALRDLQVRRGQIIANRYTALDIVGRGGMGCIYKVRDNTLGEEVALKMLLPQFVQDKIVVDRFLNEARIARQLSHPNIVRVHDIGIAGNVLYISMEFLKGSSLRGALDGLVPGQRMPLRQVLDIFDQLCSALEYAHQFTVHRDLKPENVMILEDGTVKLMDFGISKLMSNVQLTSASMVMGTPYYMSPEQLKDSRNVDARADIYSLGVMLYEVLTGNLPTGVPKAASQIRADLPPSLDPIVEVCVDPDPAKRYQNVAEFRNAFLPIKALVDSGTDARTIASKLESKGPKTGGGALRKVVGVLLLALIVGASLWGVTRAEKKRVERAATTSGEAAAPAERGGNGGHESGERFKALSSRVELAIPLAKSKAKTLNSPIVNDIVTQALTRWELAKKNADSENPARSLSEGRLALQCFLGVILEAKNPEMTFIPPGEMDLLDPATGNTGRVRLNGFLIDKTEVTNARYRDFTQSVENGWRAPQYLFSRLTNEELASPVVLVTFYDAQAYAAWAGKSLPTEAQWAMAAYGSRNESGMFPWGDTPKANAANVIGSEKGGHPTPVDQFQQEGEDVTSSGCLGMEGNVSEWTRSEYRPFPYDAHDGREDQAEFGFETILAIRGGNYSGELHPLNQRFSAVYDTKAPTIGFRCVQTVPTGQNLNEVDAALQN